MMSRRVSDRDEHRWRVSSRVWLATVIAIPVLYVVSFGPAIWVYHHCELLQRPIEVFYGPLDDVIDKLSSDASVSDHSPFWPLLEYVEWWSP